MTINTLYEGIDAYNQLIITKTDEMMTESTNFTNIIDSVCLLRENNIIFEFNIKETFKAAINKLIEFGKWLIGKIKALGKKIFNREKIDQKIADESLNVVKKNAPKVELPEELKEKLRKNIRDSVDKFDKLQNSIKKEEEKKSENKEFSVIKYLDAKKDMKGLDFKYSYNKTPGKSISDIIQFIKDETEGYDKEKSIAETELSFDDTRFKELIRSKMQKNMSTYSVSVSNSFSATLEEVENYHNTLTSIIKAKAEVKGILDNMSDHGIGYIIEDLETNLKSYEGEHFYTDKDTESDIADMDKYYKKKAKVTRYKLAAYRYLLKLSGEIIQDYNKLYTNLEYMREVVQHNVNIITKCYVDPKNKA